MVPMMEGEHKHVWIYGIRIMKGCTGGVCRRVGTEVLASCANSHTESFLSETRESDLYVEEVPSKPCLTFYRPSIDRSKKLGA